MRAFFFTALKGPCRRGWGVFPAIKNSPSHARRPVAWRCKVLAEVINPHETVGVFGA